MAYDNSFYPESDDAAPSEAGADMPHGDEAEAEETGVPDMPQGGETALLPKSVLGGKEFKPGDEVVLKIVREHDDEVEVQYATGKDEDAPPAEDGEEADSGSQMDQSMQKLASMAS